MLGECLPWPAIQTDNDSLALAATALPVLSEIVVELWVVDPTVGAEELISRPLCMRSASLALGSLAAAGLTSHKYLLMGRVSVVMQVVNGDGMLTLVNLDSDTVSTSPPTT